jgi:hypothetical protein
LCLGVTIQLRRGGTVTGTVLSKNDTNLVVLTASGEQTLTWPQLSNDSIKEIHPELYERLKQAAIERQQRADEEKRAQGLVQYQGKWIPQEEYDRKIYGRIRIKVATTEKSSSPEDIGETEGHVTVQEKHWGVLRVELQGLDAQTNYVLKTVYTHHLEYDRDDPRRGNGAPTIDKNVTKTAAIEGQRAFDVEYKTSEYTSQESKTKKGWHFTDGDRRTHTYAIESDDWDIEVYLNGKLVYREKKGGHPEFFLVGRL